MQPITKHFTVKRLICVLAILSVLVGSAAPQMTQEEEAFKFADKLIKKMTLQEKIGQLQQFTTRQSAVMRPIG